MKNNDNTLKQDFFQFLKDCGFRTKNGNSLNDFFLKFPDKLPSVSFDKSNQSFVLYYPGPADFGQQSFSFDYDHFVLAFNQAKFKHDTPKYYYSDFISSFSAISGSPLNQRVIWTFSCFSISPTILHKAIHQNKKLKRKIHLLPKWSKIYKLLED